MSASFNAPRVTRFLLLCLLGVAAVAGLLYLLTQAKPREGITSPSKTSRLERPAAAASTLLTRGSRMSGLPAARD